MWSKVFTKIWSTAGNSFVTNCLYYVYVTLPMDGKIYSDDVAFIISKENCDTVCRKSEIDGNVLDCWFTDNNAILNYEKSKFVVITHDITSKKWNTPKIPNNTENRNTVKCTCPKLIRYFIDQNLQWDAHIQHLVFKFRKHIYFFTSSTKILNKHFIRITVFATVQLIIQ